MNKSGARSSGWRTAGDFLGHMHERAGGIALALLWERGLPPRECFKSGTVCLGLGEMPGGQAERASLITGHQYEQGALERKGLVLPGLDLGCKPADQ